MSPINSKGSSRKKTFFGFLGRTGWAKVRVRRIPDHPLAVKERGEEADENPPSDNHDSQHKVREKGSVPSSLRKRECPQ